MNGVLNRNIRNFRAFKGITQGELAEKIGKTKSVVSNWERGENSPDIDSVERICQALTLTPNQLFGWEPYPEYEKYMKEIEPKRKMILELEAKKANLQEQIDRLMNDVKMLDVIKSEP